MIKYIDLSESDPEVQSVETGGSKPYGLSAGNSVLYWTQRLDVNASVPIPGAIYSLDIGEGGAGPVLQHSDMEINPLDVSASPDSDVSPDGCNGNCSNAHFCFLVPSEDGTVPACGCKTGIQLSSDNRCREVPHEFLLYGLKLPNEASEISLLSLNTGLDIPTPVPFQVSGLGAFFVGYDIVDHKVYWNEVDPPAIRRGSLLDNNTEIVIKTDIRYVSGLAIDSYSRNMYWTDSVLDRIEMAYIGSSDLTGLSDGRRKVLVSSDVRQPQSLALDIPRGLMYWADLDSNRPRIEQARLDGTERIEITADISAVPTYLAVDQLTGTLYWVDSEKEDKVITLNGEYNVGANHVHGMSILGNKFYWTDSLSNLIKVATIENQNVNYGSDLLDNVVGVQGLVAVDSNLPSTGHPCANNDIKHDCSHLCIPRNTTARVCACPDGLEFKEGSDLKCEESSGYALVAYTSTDEEEYGPRMRMFTRDVSGDVDESWEYMVESVEDDVVAVAVNVLNNSAADVYFISSVDRLIYMRYWSADNTFSNATPIITCCLDTPEDLAVDWLGSNLYWADSGRGVIEVSRLDGEARRVLYSGLDQPFIIELDPRRGQLYFISRGSPTAIQYLRMDGSSSLPPATLCTECTVSTYNNTRGITALAIEFDPTSNFDDRLIWSYSIDSNVDVAVGTVSGGYNLSNISQATELVNVDTDTPYSITLAFNHALYYAHETTIIEKILRSNDERTVLDDEMRTYTDFAIVHTFKEPGFHECSASELCSGHESLCLVIDHTYGKCTCPGDAFRVIGIDGNGIEHDSCTKTKSFLMWATTKFIYYYPLPSELSNPKMTSEPHLVPRRHHGDVIAMTYDPKNESVVWMDGDTQLLHRVSVHGVESEILGRFPDYVRPTSMTMDWIGGQVVFTDTSGYQIGVASVRKDRRDNLTIGSVMSAYGEVGSVVTPYQPRDVVFDERTKAIMWHEEGREIYHSPLSSRGARKLLLKYDKDRVIEHLTFDPSSRYIFWWNHLNEAIEGVNVDMAMESEVDEVQVTTFVRDVVSIAGLSSNTLITKNSFLFWYDRTDEVFNRCNVTKKLEDVNYKCLEKQLVWPLGDGEESIIAMMSFDQDRSASSSSLPITYACRKGSNVNCDYLCLETNGRAECKCPLFTNEACSEVDCKSHHTPCGDALECIPNTYLCDGDVHCSNGADEEDCPQCSDPNSMPCGPGDGGKCYSNTSRCDNILDCPMSASDEGVCCNEDMDEHGCISIVTGKYMCFHKEERCVEPEPLCVDGSDWKNCDNTPTPTASPSPTLSSKNKINNAVIVITVVIFVGLITFVAVVTACMYCHYVVQKKRRQRVRLPTISKASSSPPPRSDISSIYSGMSLGTESTNFGNCSSPHTGSFGKSAGFHPERSTHISNPPPSLITRRQSQVMEEDGTRSYAQSFMMSEADPCPAPNPSVDWENMSALSFSASQRGMRLTTMNGGGGHGNDNFHHRRRPLMWNRHTQAENPLHYRQTQHAGFRGNGHLYGNHHHHGGSITNNSIVSGTSRGLPYPSSALPHLHGGLGGGYDTDTLNYDAAETETVFSQSTINTDNGSHSVFVYDDRTPPGRPPSPATITECSERERRIPLTPNSVSSDEEDIQREHQV